MDALIGGIVGLLLGVIFEDPLKTVWKKIIKIFKYQFTKDKEVKDPHYFSLGNHITNFIICDGDGEMTFSQENIDTRLNNSKVELPLDLKDLRERIELEEKEKEKNGEVHSWNGPILGLEKFVITRTKINEDMKVLFTFFPTDYYTFKAINSQLDEKLADGLTTREKYIEKGNFKKPIPFLSNAVGVGLVVITQDGKVILTRRSEHSGVRPNELDISIIEGVHPSQDRDSNSQGPNLFKSAIRGAKEELGLNINESDVKYFGFGLDEEYYQWSMLGIIHANETAEEIINKRARGISGKWELDSLIFEPFNIERVLKIISREKMWSTAKVALFWALIYEFPNKHVYKAIDKYFK